MIAVIFLASLSWSQGGGTAPGQAQSDGEVASLIKAANDAEIGAGQMALEKSQADEVRGFAGQMIEDHQKSNQQIAPFVPGGGLSSAPAAKLAQEAAQQNRQLSGLSGAAFDSAYVLDQVQDHGELLRAIDRALGSSGGREPSFQELLRTTREVVAGHLTRARQLQAQLRGR
jgi:putative membrane protein